MFAFAFICSAIACMASKRVVCPGSIRRLRTYPRSKARLDVHPLFVSRGGESWGFPVASKLKTALVKIKVSVLHNPVAQICYASKLRSHGTGIVDQDGAQGFLIALPTCRA